MVLMDFFTLVLYPAGAPPTWRKFSEVKRSVTCALPKNKRAVSKTALPNKKK